MVRNRVENLHFEECYFYIMSTRKEATQEICGEVSFFLLARYLASMEFT